MAKVQGSRVPHFGCGVACSATYWQAGRRARSTCLTSSPFSEERYLDSSPNIHLTCCRTRCVTDRLGWRRRKGLRPGHWLLTHLVKIPSNEVFRFACVGIGREEEFKKASSLGYTVRNAEMISLHIVVTGCWQLLAIRTSTCVAATARVKLFVCSSCIEKTRHISMPN